MSIHGNRVPGIYRIWGKEPTVAFSITPTEQSTSSTLKYNFKFLKIISAIENPENPGKIVEILRNYIESIDKNLLVLNHSMNSINVVYPPDECFKIIIEAPKNYENTKGAITIEAHDLENRTITMRWNGYVKWTTTITPDANGSIVKWFIEPEKIEMDQDFFVSTASFIHDTMIYDMMKLKIPK